MTTGAIVAAAGQGERLGAGAPKALVRVGGRTLLEHAVTAMQTADVDVVVVTAPAERVDEFALLVPAATVVAGGATRQESVRLGLAALPADVDVVLVHDAARALVPVDMVRRVLAALRDGADAVVPVLPLSDTVKEVRAPGVVVLVHDAARALVPVDMVRRVLAAVRDGADAVVPVLPLSDTVKEVRAPGVVVRTVDRSTLRAVQTPQGFRRDVLERAHASVVTDATDDAALVEVSGVTVTTVEGSAEALKVTTPFDLTVAESLLQRRQSHV